MKMVCLLSGFVKSGDGQRFTNVRPSYQVEDYRLCVDRYSNMSMFHKTLRNVCAKK